MDRTFLEGYVKLLGIGLGGGYIGFSVCTHFYCLNFLLSINV